MTDTIFDSAIVGGGPAGCGAAITLAGLGARVVLLEAKKYPHDKLCGEFLSPECATMLEGLSLAKRLRALGPATIQIARLTAPDGAVWETRLPDIAWGLTRLALDAAMAEHASLAGVVVRPATTVTSVGGSLEGGFELAIRSAASTPVRSPPRIHARTVIAAHGKRAALDRALGRHFLDRPQPFMALKAHFHGPPIPGRVELHGFNGGYCGMSEIEGGAANVCLLVHESVFRSAAPAGADRLAAFLSWMARQNPRLHDWLSQAKPVDAGWLSIGQVPFRSKRPVEDDVLMAGDAAGLIAPLAGDGIAMALRSGGLAAARCGDFLAGRLSAAGLRRGYAADWGREFSARLRLGRALQSIMLRPRLLAPALRLVTAWPQVGRFLIARTRDMPHETRPLTAALE